VIRDAMKKKKMVGICARGHGQARAGDDARTVRQRHHGDHLALPV
jgi:hypothetical protein